MSTWKAAENIMSDDLTAEFGEPIRHFPMRKLDVNARSQTDTTRPVQIFKAGRSSKPLEGIFESLAYEAKIYKGHRENTVVPATRVSSRKPCLSIERRDFVSEIIAGDLIALVERGSVYEVTDIEPDGQGRAILRLMERGRHKIDEVAPPIPPPLVCTSFDSDVCTFDSDAFSFDEA